MQYSICNDIYVIYIQQLRRPLAGGCDAEAAGMPYVMPNVPCPDRASTTPGPCQDHAVSVVGPCDDYVRILPGPCQDHVRTMPGQRRF